MSFSAIIMAAGMGTRMKSDKCKVLHEVCSKPLVQWVYEAAEKAGSEKTVLVVGHKKEDVMHAMGEDKLYAVQEVRLGTGHAIMMAEEYFKDYDGTVVILSGDTPLITDKTVEAAVKYHEENNNSATVISAVLDNPFGYGRIVRGDDNSFIKIVEQRDASDEEKVINEINSGMYCFNCRDLFNALSKITDNNAQNEYYLTDTLEILRNEGKKTDAVALCEPDEILGVNDRVNLAVTQKIKQSQIVRKHLLNGVTIIDPDNTYIDDEVEIDADAVIYPSTFLRGNTKIAAGCIIGPSTTIENSEIGKNTKVINSVVTDSSIAENSDIGPFAYLRPNSVIGSDVKIGDFVEIKNSSIGDGTKVSHLTYVGDSDVGKGVNFGCGTVTVNYDGVSKHRTVIGDNVFLGCNTNLVAPVKVANNSVIAAGSTITENVDEYSLAIARSRQTEKKNWAREFGWNTKKKK